MRKTSIYLDDDDVERLRRLAAAEGRSQAEIVRAALSAYEQVRIVPRDFALEDSWSGDGSSVADVSEEELLAGSAGSRLRALINHEVDRCERLLDSGDELVGRLHGWARLAVAGYVAGGRAAVDALRRSVSGRAADILTGPPRPRRRDVLRHLLGALHEPPTRRGAVSNAHQPASGEVQ